MTSYHDIAMTMLFEISYEMSYLCQLGQSGQCRKRSGEIVARNVVIYNWAVGIDSEKSTIQKIRGNVKVLYVGHTGETARD